MGDILLTIISVRTERKELMQTFNGEETHISLLLMSSHSAPRGRPEGQLRHGSPVPAWIFLSRIVSAAGTTQSTISKSVNLFGLLYFL